jgi:hypothetical protein
VEKQAAVVPFVEELRQYRWYQCNDCLVFFRCISGEILWRSLNFACLGVMCIFSDDNDQLEEILGLHSGTEYNLAWPLNSEVVNCRSFCYPLKGNMLSNCVYTTCGLLQVLYFREDAGLGDWARTVLPCFPSAAAWFVT